MQLEDYFDFVSDDDIRLRGHRVGIEDVVSDYLEGYAPEEIVAHLPSLSLEETHAAITYYLHNRAHMDRYLSRLAAWREQSYREWAATRPPVVQRLRAMKERAMRDQEAVA